MIIQYKTLLTVQIAHAYYTDGCEDIGYIFPDDTAQTLSNGRLLARDSDGSLIVLFEGNGAGGARAPIPGRTLRIGLKLTNPFFTNFTAVDPGFASSTLLYRNSAAVGALAPPESVSMVAQRFSHVLASAARPVTATLTNATGAVIETDTVTAANNQTMLSYDLTGQPSGSYVVTEVAGAATTTTAYYVDSQLLAAQVFGVIEIDIDAGFYTAAPTFSLPFAAREETLKYYVVVTNYPAATPSPWSVTDNGAVADGRTPILFNQVAAASFTPDDIAPALLGAPAATVVLFESAAAVARSEAAKTSIQLENNGEVLMPNLPQPGQEMSTADMIIAVSKPNSSTTP